MSQPVDEVRGGGVEGVLPWSRGRGGVVGQVEHCGSGKLPVKQILLGSNKMQSG